MNAVLLASRLAQSGPEEARASLDRRPRYALLCPGATGDINEGEGTPHHLDWCGPTMASG
jgi:hypothetical protein